MRLDLDFPDDIPDGWTSLEGVVVLKLLDEEGVVQLRQTYTSALTPWEAAGMLLWALDATRDCLRGDPE